MRRTRWLLTVLLALGGWTFYSPPAHAGCVVETTGTYAEGTNLRDDKCDRGGNKKVTSGTTPSGTGAATAAAPSLAEASIGYFSWDLSGNLRVTQGTLEAGEDLVNDLVKTSGGAVRGTVGNVASGLLIAADCTSHCTPAAYVALPTGSKTFTSTIVSATSGDTVVKQTHKIYGANTSSFTSDDAQLLCTNTFVATTQYLTKKFTQSCDPVTANFLFYGVISSGTGSGAGVVTGAVDATY